MPSPATESLTLRDVDPSTGRVLAEIPCTSAEEVGEAVTAARAAQPAWAARGLEGRLAVLERVAARLEDAELVERMAQRVTAEMGKPIASARGEAKGTARAVRRTAGRVAEALAPRETSEGALTTRLTWQPHGVVAAITPWNFPLAMANSLIAPALAAGNTVVFKPSETTPLAGRDLYEAYAAELPEGVLHLVQGDDRVGKALVASPVDMVAFVGSVEAGRHIMAACAPSLKRLVLELGGKDPMIVCADADLDAAADHAVRESMRNSGQVCCAVERIYVETAVADAFTEKVVEKARALKVGDGREDGVFMGPMASAQQRDGVTRQVEDARAKGARVLLGGRAVDGPGFYFEPTVVADVDESMDLLGRETFGPVATIRAVEDAETAVTLANGSPFGLGASVWAGDLERARQLAARVESGMVGVNRGLGAAGDAPWAGVKQSGFGFLGSPDGYRQFARPHVMSWDRPA